MTAASVLPPLQQAAYDRAVGDAGLGGLVTGVFDEVPEGQAYPYVVLGEAIETAENWHGGFGRQALVTFHVWSHYRGYAEATRIVNRLVALFDHQPLTLAGHHDVAVRFEQTQTLRDPNPEIRHAPVRFRVTTEQE